MALRPSTASLVGVSKTPTRGFSFAPPKTPGLSGITAASSNLLPVQVYLRLRPLAVGESPNDAFIVDIAQHAVSVTTKNSTTRAQYSNIFTPDVSNEGIFAQGVLPYLPPVFLGQNLLLMAYGITASGKTHTICGSQNERGLIELVLTYLLENTPDPNELLAQFSSTVASTPAAPPSITPRGVTTSDPLASPPPGLPPDTPTTAAIARNIFGSGVPATPVTPAAGAPVLLPSATPMLQPPPQSP